MLARVFGGRHEFRVPYIAEKYLAEARSARRSPFSSMASRIAIVLDLHQGVDPPTLIDASNLYLYLIDALWAVYSEVRFILGVRNVRDFARSAMARGWHQRRPEELMIFPGDPGYDAWKTLSPAERMAQLWIHRNGLALRALTRLPAECWTIVRIEELDASELGRLSEFAGVTPGDAGAIQRRVNEGPNLAVTGSHLLAPEDERTLRRTADPLMNQLGYTCKEVRQGSASRGMRGSFP